MNPEGEEGSGRAASVVKAKGCKQMNKAYVSEFTVFINGYLKAHPAVIADRQRGWAFYWDPGHPLPGTANPAIHRQKP